jgi:zinc transport system substrate-binding protein
MARLIVFILVTQLAAPARATVATSIVPLQAWARELLGESEAVSVLVQPGQSPELFEPTSRQLADLAGAELLFAIGVPFEVTLLPRLGRMFPDLQVVELGADIERLDWPGSGSSGPSHDGDPHVWLDPELAAALVGQMGEVLARRRPLDEEGIRQRARGLQDRFLELDRRLSVRLAPLAGQPILAYHPALGYFAQAYGMHQLAVESGGAEPGARHLAGLAETVRSQSLRVLVVEPQFAPQRARALAGSFGLEVVVFDPLAADLVSELDRLADTLVGATDRGQP